MFGFKKLGQWIGNASRKTHRWVGKNLSKIEFVEKWAPRAGLALGTGLALTGVGAPIGAAVIGGSAAIGAGAGLIVSSHKGVNTIGNGINTVGRIGNNIGKGVNRFVNGFSRTRHRRIRR